MTEKHIPLPIAANGSRTQDKWLVNPDDRHQVIGQHGIVIAQCETFDLPAEETAHNAAYIVKACNAHDELVKAVEWAAAKSQDAKERAFYDAILAKVQS